jgi:hypothetical protein
LSRYYKKRRPAGRYYPNRRSSYLPRLRSSGGGYSGPKSYVRHHDFKYPPGEQQPREPKSELSSYVKSPAERFSERPAQVQPDVEALLEELKRTRDPALLEQVTEKMNYETEKMENAATPSEPQVGDVTEKIEDQEEAKNLPSGDDSAEEGGEIWMTMDEVQQIDETFRRSEEAEEERIDNFFEWIENSTRNPSSEQFEVDEPLESHVPLESSTLPETATEPTSLDALDLPINDLEMLTTELYAPEVGIAKELEHEPEPENEYDY